MKALLYGRLDIPNAITPEDLERLQAFAPGYEIETKMVKTDHLPEVWRSAHAKDFHVLLARSWRDFALPVRAFFEEMTKFRELGIAVLTMEPPFDTVERSDRAFEVMKWVLEAQWSERSAKILVGINASRKELKRFGRMPLCECGHPFREKGELVHPRGGPCKRCASCKSYRARSTPKDPRRLLAVSEEAAS